MLTNRKWNLETVFDSLVRAFQKVLFSDLFLTNKNYLNTFNSFLWRKNKISKFKDSEKEFKAIPVAVTAQGKLLLLDPAGKLESEIDFNKAQMLYHNA